jgi:proteasome lid subunit RPN8/RPN11
MVMVLEDSLVREIARVGQERLPNEACGLLLPLAINGRQVLEVPNRSRKPHDSFEMKGSDIFLALQGVYGEDLSMDQVDRMIPDIAVWHTHPHGGVGPSKADMDNKPDRFKSLVVTLREGEPPLATWF